MDEETGELISDGLDGVMTLIQLLVLTLHRQERLDMLAFAADLLAFRKDEAVCPPQSMRAHVIDRMLDMLVEDRSEVLLRRAQIHVVLPKSPPIDPADENGS